MLVSIDTNILAYAADPDSPNHERARDFLNSGDENVVLTQLVLVELYMLLRNKAVFKQPYSAQGTRSCRLLPSSRSSSQLEMCGLYARNKRQALEMG